MGIFNKLFGKKQNDKQLTLYFDGDKLSSDSFPQAVEVENYIEVLNGKEEFPTAVLLILKAISLEPVDFAILCCVLYYAKGQPQVYRLRDLIGSYFSQVENKYVSINPLNDQLFSIDVKKLLDSRKKTHKTYKAKETKKEEKPKKEKIQSPAMQETTFTVGQTVELPDGTVGKITTIDEVGQSYVYSNGKGLWIDSIKLKPSKEIDRVPQEPEEKKLTRYVDISIESENSEITSYLLDKESNQQSDLYKIQIDIPSLAKQGIYFDGTQFSSTRLKSSDGSLFFSNYISQLGKDKPDFKIEISNVLARNKVNPNMFAILSTMFYLANLFDYAENHENNIEYYKLLTPDNVNQKLADVLLSGSLAIYSEIENVRCVTINEIEAVLERNHISLSRFCPVESEMDFVPIIDDEFDVNVEPSKKEAEKEITNTVENDFVPIIEETEPQKTYKNQFSYLGIDFGTSFTKLSYMVSNNDRACIRSSNGYFMPTEVFFNGTTLSMVQKDNTYLPVKYFKYDMIPNKETESLITKNVRKLIPTKLSVEEFSSICAAFYLACVLSICDKEVCAKSYFISMGKPFAPKRKDDKKFDDILKIAYLMFDKGIGSESVFVELAELYNSLNKKIEGIQIPNVKLATRPEIVTETDFLLSRETYEPGDYVIVDVGGGTADFMYIRKAYSTNFGEYDAITCNVVPLGASTKESYGKTIYREKLCKAFVEFMSYSKKAVWDISTKDIKFLLFGGGALDKDVIDTFFNSGLFQTIKSKLDIKISRDLNLFPKNYFVNELALSDDEKKRLVITTQLSNPIYPKLGTLPFTPPDIIPDEYRNPPIITKVKPEKFTYVINRDGTVEKVRV